MKVNNKKNIQITLYLLILLLLFSILLTGIFYIVIPVNYGITIFVLLISILSLLKLIMLKTFSIEVSEHFISIKQTRLVSKRIEFPTLEVPLQKGFSFKIKKKHYQLFLHSNYYRPKW